MKAVWTRARIWWFKHDVRDKLETLMYVVLIVYCVFASTAAWQYGKAANTTAQTSATAATFHHAQTTLQNDTTHRLQRKTNGLEAANSKLLRENNTLQVANLFLATANHALLTEHSSDLANFNIVLKEVAAEQQSVIDQLPADATAITGGQANLQSTLDQLKAEGAATNRALQALCTASHISCPPAP